MNQLLETREYLKKFYGKYELYIVPAIKFVFAFIVFLLINGRLGYMDKIAKFPIALILALLCSFLPVNFIVVLAALLSLAHVYALSLEAAAVVGILFLIMFLLYFRFSPKDAFVVILTPLCCLLKIPYVIPISVGLLGSPGSSVSTGCGVITYFVLEYVREISSSVSSLDSEGVTSKFKYIIDGAIGNKGMIVMAAAFIVTTIVVYYVRRMNIDHAWTIAIIVGGLTDVLVLLVGDLIFNTNLSVFGVLFGTLLSVAVAIVIKFFAFNLDYARTERVQFEDDDYYYYVKAVPKVMVSTSEKKVKKVSAKEDSDVKKAVVRRSTEESRATGEERTRSRASGVVAEGNREVRRTVAEGNREVKRTAAEGSREVRRTVADGNREVRRTVSDENSAVRRTVSGSNSEIRRDNTDK